MKPFLGDWPRGQFPPFSLQPKSFGDVWHSWLPCFQWLLEFIYLWFAFTALLIFIISGLVVGGQKKDFSPFKFWSQGKSFISFLCLCSSAGWRLRLSCKPEGKPLLRRPPTTQASQGLLGGSYRAGASPLHWPLGNSQSLCGTITAPKVTHVLIPGTWDYVSVTLWNLYLVFLSFPGIQLLKPWDYPEW
jgi:hypothetical protein